MTTRTELMAAYRRALAASYGWAQDDVKLTAFMQSVKRTLNDEPGCKAILEGASWDVAMTECGLPKRTSRRALRALPLGDTNWEGPELTLVFEPMYPTRPGDQPAIMAQETGIDYARCLVMCNMD